MLRQRKASSCAPTPMCWACSTTRPASVTGVRYLDLLTGREHEQPADVVVLAAFTMSNTHLLLSSRIGRPTTRSAGTAWWARTSATRSMPGSIFMKERWFNPFLATGSTQMCIDDFNNDNFDHSGLGFLGGGSIGASQFAGRPIRNRRLPPGRRWAPNGSRPMPTGMRIRCRWASRAAATRTATTT
jgi:gluconate 2-dehydrogenase alpha chain